MTLIVLVLVAVAVGHRIGHWWTVGVPVLAGAAWALLLSATGHGLADTPIPFVAAAATLGVAVGVALGRRLERPAL